MTYINTVVKQVYLVCVEGFTTNKHYFVVLVRTESAAGAVAYNVKTAWGAIGSAPRLNKDKLVAGGEFTACVMFDTIVKQRMRKGYEIEKSISSEVPARGIPSFWYTKHTNRKQIITKPQPEPSTLLRKDAPWAF